MKETVAEIILPLPVKSDFSYRVPEAFQGILQPGMRVLVTFGKRKVYTGVVRKVTERLRPAGPNPLKEIDELLDEVPVITPLQMQLMDWTAFYYFCTAGEVLKAAMPAGMKPESSMRVEAVEGINWQELPLGDKEFILMEALLVRPSLTLQEISDIWNVQNPAARLKTMAGRGLIRVVERVEEKYKPLTEKYYELSEDFKGDPAINAAFESLSKAPKQEDVLMLVVKAHLKGYPVAKKEISKQIKGADAAIRALQEKGILKELLLRVDRLEFHSSGETKKEITLTLEQERALREIRESIATAPEKPVLLHGVTGSGKTHLYIELMREALAKGKQALYLLPEIALTKQIVDRIRAEFGDKAGVYHSRFTDAERVEIWQKVLKREYEIVVGVRSSVFLPFSDLGFIVVDEEHEHSFKQQEPAPRYHARDLAVFLARMSDCPILLGSATPSFESYHNAETGKYHLVELHARAIEAKMPVVGLVDLREATKKKQMEGAFSERLKREIETVLAQREQVILFQNRRGYVPFLVCSQCGNVPHCQNCDITLTYHKHRKELRCHYCGFTDPHTDKCRVCGHYEFKMEGLGTEKIEEEIQAIFPNHKVGRMDLDTTRNKHGVRNIISAFEKHETEILVGTQMVTKGLDFGNVTLVGVMDADPLLNFPDFRANERAWQLLTQVAGRAGRSEKPGKVIIQTRMPDAMFFTYLRGDFRSFYHHEIAFRQRLAYPPFSRLIRIEIRHRDRDYLLKESKVLKEALMVGFSERLLGPEFPHVARVRNLFRMQFLIKLHRSFSAEKVRTFLSEVIDRYYREAEEKTLRIVVDVDPV